MNIVVLDGYTLNPGDLSWKELEKLGECRVFDRTTEKEIRKRAGDADCVLVNKVSLNRKVLRDLKSLKYIGVLATGYDNVDIETCHELKIVVSNVPGYSSPSVAQLVFAFCLTLTHHIGHHSEAVHQGRWSATTDFSFWDFPLIEMAGKTMGIVGYGQIGQLVAKIALGFGMKVVVATRASKDKGDPQIQFVDLDRVFVQSDFLTLHCPLTEKTRDLVHAKRLRLMKKSAYLINTSRGGLIDEEALREALMDGVIAGAALDVLVHEPPPKVHPLIGLKNCLITPHLGWATLESRQRLLSETVKNLQCFIQGKPGNVVSNQAS